jgi:hypothetical protein
VESVSDRWVTGDSNEFYYGYDLIDEDVWIKREYKEFMCHLKWGI